MLSEHVPSKVLFYMPHETQHFLPALAAIQSYVSCLIDRTRGHIAAELPALHIIADQVHHYLLKCIDKAPVVVLSNYDFVPKRGVYDLVFNFDDLESIYSLAFATRTHITRIYGLMIGSTPETVPDLSAIKLVGEDYVGLLETPFQPELVAYLKSRYQAKTLLLDLPDQISEVQFRIIETCQMFIGPQSGATYVAASLGKKVVELVPGDRYPRWLSKFVCPSYFMIYGHANLEQVIKGVDSLWESHSETLSSTSMISYGQGIQTELTMSGAEVVDE